MSTDEQKLNTIFSEALAKPSPQDREAYIAAACGGDLGLRRQLDSLLEAHAEAGDFLRNPVVGPEEKGKCSEGPGTVIGRYKLLQQIGEGGFGIVFMAEQQEPVRRLVALKILKAGMDTKEVVARFEAERQALALMDHPNVARVLDGGTTDTGRPYFVMDLVKGIPITEFCDRNRLSTEARLRLFLQVCAGVQHAHQKGVIHRDLKPTNVLVMVQEGKPVPKVIDFGIAKALGQKLTERTLFTRFEQLIGTPAYMSPEQAEWGGVDIDTRSDIYSLGALLYELLTGTTPFEKETLARAALDEVRRLLRETDPPNPSLRLQGLGQRLQDIAQERQVEPKLLTRMLRGELDWIVMKSLEKDRARRYETANALARDVERHLLGEPVVACPPTRSYRFRKLVHRHKLVVTATAAVMGALVIGLAVCAWMYVRERQAREEAVAARREQTKLRLLAQARETQAQAEAAKSLQVAQFLTDMFEEVGPSVAIGRDTTLLKEVLDKAADRAANDLSNAPAVAVDLLLTLSETYLQMRLFQQAELTATQAVQISRSSSGVPSAALGRALDLLGHAQSALAKNEQAEASLREALAIRQKLFGSDDLLVADSLEKLAWTLASLGRTDESEQAARRALMLRQKALGNEDARVAKSLVTLANVLRQSDRPTEAEPYFRQALALYRKLLGDNNLDTTVALHRFSLVLIRLQKFREAEAALREAVTTQKKLTGKAHPELLLSYRTLANLVARQHRPQEAEALYREALEIHSQLPPSEVTQRDVPLPGLKLSLARVLWEEGKLPEAEAILRQMVENQRQHFGEAYPEKLRVLADLIELLCQEGKKEEAQIWSDDVLGPALKKPLTDPRLLDERADFFAHHARWKEAAEDLSRAIEGAPDNISFWHSRAAILLRQGDLNAYRDQCQSELARFGKTTNPLVAEQLSKDCLLSASSATDVTQVGRITDVATNDLAQYWCQLCKALGEYRQGSFLQAADWTQRALAGAEADAMWEAVVQAEMVLAMARYRSGQSAEAKTALAEGLQIADAKLPKADAAFLGDSVTPRDWIFAHILIREARDLIEGPTTRDAAQSAGNPMRNVSSRVPSRVDIPVSDPDRRR